MVAVAEAAATELERRRAWQAAQGFDSRWLDADQLRALEPDVAGDAVGALFLPGEGLIDPRALGQAASRAAQRKGVRLLTGHGADGLLVQAGRARGVRLRGGGVIGADTVVVAAGAWSGRLSGLPRPLPIRPVRGQMLALRGGARIAHMIVSADIYLLPRGDDESPQVWVGATMEEAGFEKATTAAARATLMGSATRLVPGLAGSTVLEHWAGLRPGTPDGLPVLGPDPDVAGLLYATGHFRNGILLAPITARLLGRVLAGDRPPELLPFRPERFAADIGA
jgi:glycine oxidase